MNHNSRTKNSMLNLVANFLYQLLIILISFFSRRVFIEALGVEYLGINGLFTNILGILSLAELGIASAMSYNMYKELVDNNVEKLKALNTYYKILYNRIALVVFTIGIAILPILKYIVNVETEMDDIYIYYVLFLLNTVFSYLFVYKMTVVSADQSEYKLKIITSCFEISRLILQIIALKLFHSYLIYIIIQIFMAILGNFIKSKYAEKWYPFIKEKSQLNDEDKKDIWDNIKSMFCYKLGWVIQSNTDNILTSIIVNTAMVGYYSNYTMIFNKIEGFISLFFQSIIASVGNLNATSSDEKKSKIFGILTFLNAWIYTYACIGIYFVGEDFIIAMSGNTSFVLEKSILIIGLIHFFVKGIQYPVSSFRSTTGLFKMAKYSVLVCAVVNLFLSIILGIYFGLYGIILATVISLLLTNIWYEPYLLYKNFFKSSPLPYFIKLILRALLIIVIIAIMIPIIEFINIDHLYIRILVKALICTIIPNLILLIIYHKSEEFQFLIEKLKDIVKGMKHRKRTNSEKEKHR